MTGLSQQFELKVCICAMSEVALGSVQTRAKPVLLGLVFGGQEASNRDYRECRLQKALLTFWLTFFFSVQLLSQYLHFRVAFTGYANLRHHCMFKLISLCLSLQKKSTNLFVQNHEPRMLSKEMDRPLKGSSQTEVYG